MYAALAEHEQGGGSVRVALIGAGSMGVGIAWQIAAHTGHHAGFDHRRRS